MLNKTHNNYSLLLNNSDIENLNTTWDQIVSWEKKLDSFFNLEDWKIYIYLDEDYLKRIFKNIEWNESKEIEEEFNKIFNTEVIFKNNKIIYKYEVLNIEKLNLHFDYFNTINDWFAFATKINNENTFVINANEIVINWEVTWMDDISIIKANSWDTSKIFNQDLDIYDTEYIWQQPIWNYIVLKTLLF